MQFVYLLVNEHVPNLVKFGFTARDPQTRAIELSSPTAVPGSWQVYRYWEVIDAAEVERIVFQRLAEYRLGRQEFFRLDPGQAVRRIARVISFVGIDPVAVEIAKAAAIAERKLKENTSAIAIRKAEADRALATESKIDVASVSLHKEVPD